MTESEYFAHPAVSNTRLKSLDERLNPKPVAYHSENGLRDGKLYDRRVTASFKEYSDLLLETGKPGEAEMFEKMYAVLCKDRIAFDMLMSAKKQVPFFRDVTFRYNGIAFTLPCKCLYDFYLSSFGGDLKTFKGKTFNQFMATAKAFDWISSRVFYMLVSRGSEAKEDFIIAQGKIEPYPVYRLSIEKGDKNYIQGLNDISRKAYQYYLLRH